MLRRFTWLAVIGLTVTAPRSARLDTFGDRDVIRARELLEASRPLEALGLLDRALESLPTGSMATHARYLAAQAALRAGAAKRALDLAKGLDVELAQVADFVWALEARAHRQLLDWDAAQASWQRLLQRFPRSPLAVEARYAMADARMALGDLHGARTAYASALSASTRTDRASVAKYNLARLAELLGNEAEAARAYGQIAYGNPSDAMHDAAAARLETLIAARRAAPPSFETHLGKVDRLLSARSLEEAAIALTDLAQSATQRSHQLALDYRRAQLAFRQRDYDLALELFGRLAASASGGKLAEYHGWMARTYSAADRVDEAVGLYANLSDRLRHSASGRDSLYRAAWIAFNGGHYRDAVGLFHRYVELYPRDRSADDALWFLAWSSYRAGDLPGALESLRRLRTAYPSSTLEQRSFYWEARILARLGQTPDAREAYARTIELGPLDYYAVLASARLREIEYGPTPLAMAAMGTLIASADDVTVIEQLLGGSDDDSLEPAPDELPPGGLSRRSGTQPLPWGASVFDWSTPEAQRALTLMELGLNDAAAGLVDELTVLPGFDGEAVSYARARLLYELGDFNAAYRIASIVWKRDLGGRPEGNQRAIFHMAYPRAHERTVTKASQEFGVSPLLVLSIMRQESAFDDRARSFASAHGLMQIIPTTARRIAQELGHEQFNNGWLNHPETNVRFGAWYLAQLSRKFRGHLGLAIAAYNAGPLAVESWVDDFGALSTDEFVEQIPYKETRGYVKRVLSNLAAYTELYESRPLQLPEAVPTSYLDNVRF